MTMPDDRPQKLAAGPVAIVGQSGGIAMAIKRTLEERGVDTGSVVTSGNETGLTTADYIGYFARQPDVKAIVSYLESVHDPAAFLASCRTARAAGKPVVVVKLGASDAGLVHAPLPKGAGLGAITFSGGLRGMLLDAAAAQNLRFSPLAEVTRRRIEKLVAVGTIIGNPLDAGFAALTSQDAYLKCIETLLDDPGIDALLLQEELPRGPGTERKEANLKAVNAIAARAGKPIAFVTMISHGMTDYSRALRSGLPNIAFLQEIDKSLAAMRSVIAHAEIVRAKISPAVPAQKPKPQLARVLARAAGALNEVESKALLKAYGIAVPRESVAHSEKEAAALATKVGFPVVAKAVSAALAHKTEAGAVLLNLKSGKDARKAYRRIVAAGKRAKATLDGVLIAEQVSDGIELVLGVHRDPEMGPVILFGAGGVELELHPDVAFAALPLDEDTALALIARTRVAKIIEGYRGAKALDRKALVKALLGLSQLAMDAGAHLQSIDVNPFLLKRRGAVALDALVVLS
jgi:acetyltransferase